MRAILVSMNPETDRAGAATPRWGNLLWLTLLALALGWFEAAVVVYLRELYYPEGFSFPLRLMSVRLARVEIAREAASLLLLTAAAVLAGRRFLDRCAAFFLLFGIWDLVYYAALWLVLGWPASLADWDVLFLIPVPWLAPVWAPAFIALTLVLSGAYLYVTPSRARRYQALDWASAIAGGLVVVAAFIWDWRAVAEGRWPQPFPAAVFWAGWGLAAAAWVWAEFLRPALRRAR